MISAVRGGGGHPLRALALVLAICHLARSGARANDDAVEGFPLKYHSVYGYGGRGLGVGVFGGYPFYGGPGYPCLEPGLNRFGRTTPFPFNGGPGYPRYGHSNYFEEPGPLVVNPPVAIIRDPDYSGGFGPFTGALPYPESYFSRFTSAAAATGSSTGTVSP